MQLITHDRVAANEMAGNAGIGLTSGWSWVGSILAVHRGKNTTNGRLAHMVERSLSMREARRSILRLSKLFVSFQSISGVQFLMRGLMRVAVTVSFCFGVTNFDHLHNSHRGQKIISCQRFQHRFIFGCGFQKFIVRANHLHTWEKPKRRTCWRRGDLKCSRQKRHARSDAIVCAVLGA